MFSHFTIKEANEILPKVIKNFNYISTTKKMVAKIQTELETNPKYSINFKEFIIKKQELNSEITNFYKAIEELENIGVVIKSLDEGLIDFPSLRFNEEIYLCWKDGETEIKFWHGKDEGFMARKPIETVDLEKLR